jgi:hypothetical protein
MKGLFAVVLLALALPSFGQIRGVPASVTSFGPGRGSTPGIPASVTSLGPLGFSNHNGGGLRTQSFHSPRPFNGNNGNTICSTPGALIPSAMGCTSVGFTNQFFGQPVSAVPTNGRGRNNGHGRGRGGNNYYPVYVPYSVPVVVDQEASPEQAAAADDSEEPPAMTVFERRPMQAMVVPSAPMDESRVYHPAPNQAAPAPAEERMAPAIVLIYKDGHEREVQNYAIMGNYVYDIGSFVAQKIPIADLNVKATMKANDDRGVDFSLPASVTP